MKALLAFMIVFLPTAALACSLAPWPGEVVPTAQMVGDRALSNQPVFMGKVEITNLAKDDSEETRYDLKVLKQYLGEPAESITASTNETNSCSFFGKVGDVVLVSLNKDVEEKFNISLVSGYFFGVDASEVEAYLDQWKASGQPVPAPAPEAAAPVSTIEAPVPAKETTPATPPQPQAVEETAQ